MLIDGSVKSLSDYTDDELKAEMHRRFEASMIKFREEQAAKRVLVVCPICLGNGKILKRYAVDDRSGGLPTRKSRDVSDMQWPRKHDRREGGVAVTDRKVCYFLLGCAVVGALLGFGSEGTAQKAAMGAGLGAISGFFFLILCGGGKR